MAQPWKLVALGALSGAAIAVTIVYAAALSGAFPQDDRHLHAYLIAHPEIFADMGTRYQEQQDDEDDQARQRAVDRLGEKAFFNPKLAFIAGPERARTTIVEFFDYNCPHCRRSFPAVQRFYEAHKADARFAFIEFPIQGPQSIIAARAAVAARRQPDKYIAFHFAMMNEDGPVDEDIVYRDARRVGLDVEKLKSDMNDPAIANVLSQSLELAHDARIDGTPEFIVDGKSREGEVDDTQLKQMTSEGVSRS